MDHLGRAALADGHVQGVEDPLRAEVPDHGPAYHPSTPRVEHDREEEEPGSLPFFPEGLDLAAQPAHVLALLGH